ncbi:MAG: UDP-glucose/GDP-mannose dehydrogenase family protein [Patescibacteria group bacterium]
MQNQQFNKYPLNVAVIGAGHIGLVTAASFAQLGNQVVCVDNNSKKIDDLKKNKVTFYEPGLKDIVLRNKRAKSLTFSNSIKEATERSLVIFICVGTPSLPDGSTNLSAVQRVALEIAKSIKEYKIIVEKSTVPAETGEKIKKIVEMNTPRKIDFDIVSNPEFLREGQALYDTFHPDRIILGLESKKAEKIMRRLYSSINAPIIVTNTNTAEIIKHASNCFLTTKISYINAIANLCEKVNADIAKVSEALGLDKRIGRNFLNAGAGFGGYCFPKDLNSFIHFAGEKGYDFELLKAVRKINQEQKMVIVKKIQESFWSLKGKRIGVLGLSFKPDTDDIRNSIAVDIIKILIQAGADIKSYDPQAMPNAQKELKDITFSKSAYDAARNSDCLVILTEWREFRSLDLKKIKSLLRQPIIIDGRNIFNPEQMKQAGFIYKSIGRQG